jgi:enoyl-CoA hydratase
MQKHDDEGNLVLVERSDRILLLTLNRPAKLNALSKELLKQLASRLQDAKRDPRVSCVVLTGSGRAFSAGADISDMLVKGVASYTDPERLVSWHSIEKFPKPIIAAVNGFAVGGGLELALLCDIILAAQSAEFSCPEIKIGSFPGDGGTQLLPRLVGRSFAMQMVLTGMKVDASLAEKKGLVSEVLPDKQLMGRAFEIASEIAQMSTAITPFAKRAVKAADLLSLDDGLEFEHRLTVEAFDTFDRVEGLRSFTEKRPPKFENR